MPSLSLKQRSFETARHRTVWHEAGPQDGPLMIFIHGWPELGLIWRAQVEHFAQAGWRCVAPDMRGYGGSSVPTSVAAYAVRELVTDMIELHDALGGAPAIWVGHDWGCPVVWAMASHHAGRCRGVANLCVPYIARGFALPNLVPLVDREVYPIDRYPVGQWDYWLYYREHFGQAARQFEADVERTFASLNRRTPTQGGGEPAFTATIRARGGWLSDARPLSIAPAKGQLLDAADFAAHVAAFRTTGFRGADAWYMNDAANMAYAAEACDFGQLTLPVLFLHAARDTVCNTYGSRLADPMREDCTALTERTIDAAHALMLEDPMAVNEAIAEWLNL